MLVKIVLKSSLASRKLFCCKWLGIIHIGAKNIQLFLDRMSASAEVACYANSLPQRFTYTHLSTNAPLTTKLLLLYQYAAKLLQFTHKSVRPL